MALWIGVGIFLLVVFGLAAIGQRRRGGNRSWELGRAPGGGQAERNATGSTVTRNIQNEGNHGL